MEGFKNSFLIKQSYTQWTQYTLASFTSEKIDLNTIVWFLAVGAGVGEPGRIGANLKLFRLSICQFRPKYCIW